jgi:hypothetical protein
MQAQPGALDSSGSVDPSFDPGSGVDNPWLPEVASVVVQNDGKILIGGSINSFNGVTRHNIARLNADGSLDQSFDPREGPDSPLGPDGIVYSMVVQSDRKILVGGQFH